ncbi:protein split ends [Trichonephila clavipes]|nr:protein split ends [Trichonephila clavipes]
MGAFQLAIYDLDLSLLVSSLVWLGPLQLLEAQANVKLFFVSGNRSIFREPNNLDSYLHSIRVTHTTSLEPWNMKVVEKKIQMYKEHCALIALPFGNDYVDALRQFDILRNGITSYLECRNVSGVVLAPHPETNKPVFVMHVFPSCDLANTLFERIPLPESKKKVVRENPHAVILIHTTT